MDQKQLAVYFRGTELENRRKRRANLLHQVESVLRLEHEELNEAERQAHLNAVTRLRAVERAVLRDIEAGYWEKLWLAIRGKLS